MGFGKMVSPYRFNSVMRLAAGADTRKFRILDPVKRTQRASDSDCRRTPDEPASPSRRSGLARVEERSRWVSDGNAVTKELRIRGGIDLAPRTLRRWSPGNAGGSSERRSLAERLRR